MLTKKQYDLLCFIDARLRRDNVPPSFDEMKVALDLRSKSGIHRLITALEERGYVRRLPHRARALEILRMPGDAGTEAEGLLPRVVDGDRPDSAAPADGHAARSGAASELPVMGRIAAGAPIEAINESASTVTVPGGMIAAQSDHYALEVKGDSMIEAGINEGDVVVIREQTTAENGDIVVALVEGYEATLKRFRRKGSAIALEAANPAYETRILREDQVALQGRLVGLIRSY